MNFDRNNEFEKENEVLKAEIRKLRNASKLKQQNGSNSQAGTKTEWEAILKKKALPPTKLSVSSKLQHPTPKIQQPGLYFGA